MRFQDPNFPSIHYLYKPFGTSSFKILWENLVGKYHISTSLYLARIHIFFDKFLCLKYTNFKNDVMESYPKILETLDQKPLHTFWRLNRA